MKRVAILSAVNIKHMSLISMYTRILNNYGIPYDIIYMDKYGIDEFVGATNTYRYVNLINTNWSKITKILHYLKFIPYAKRILESNDYDCIIVWNDVAITMFGLYLSRKWKGKYCLNIRDYNGEEKWYIYRVFEKAIKSSAFTTISSEGFRAFLPQWNYVSLYSYNKSILDKDLSKKEWSIDRPINISFIGNVRFFDQNRRLIDVFKNDKRFLLSFHGTNSDIIQRYAESIDANNVLCTGPFQIEETSDYLTEADIINNVFGNMTTGVRTLTSIRLFHGASMRIPIIVSKDTYMAKIVSEYHLGYVVEAIDERLPDLLFDWYCNFNKCIFISGCERLIDEAERANSQFEDVATNFLFDTH